MMDVVLPHIPDFIREVEIIVPCPVVTRPSSAIRMPLTNPDAEIISPAANDALTGYAPGVPISVSAPERAQNADRS